MESQKIQTVNLVIVEKANLLNKRIYSYHYNYAGIKEAENLFRDKFVEYCNPQTDEDAWKDVFEKCLDEGFFETDTIHASLKY